MGSQRARQIDKILSEIGLYGSIWVHIEGIRSHVGYKGSDIPKRELVCYIILILVQALVWKHLIKKVEKYACSRGRLRGIQILVGHVGVF